ncbi:penicillin-binding protein 1C [Bdellovibrio sp. BCCA]|uniref:penicillin-binding protein 1C n=1 Tax=Bdellovibrio sp. BCCA TaxID=3136281 RepID=UPI0030F0668E
MDGERVKKKNFICSLAAILGGGALCVGAFFQTNPAIESFENVKSSYRSSELFLLDRDGKPLHQWRQNTRERTFMWSALKDISPAMISAVLKSEDQNFYEHSGADSKALIASLYQRLFKNSSRGGSTITMQVLKLTTTDKKVYQGVTGKLRQIVAAYKLESQWTKEQILEAYLNLVPFRGEYRGLSSISWTLFDKRPQGLTLKEATLLSVLIRSPNAKPPEWAQRACWQEPSLCAEFQASIAELVQKSAAPLSQQYALHLAQKLSSTGAHGEVITSLQKDLQVYAQEIIASQLRSLESQNVHNAAVLVIENKTGQVWAYISSEGSDKKSSYVDGIQALRQAGSTLKPFLYATAFEKNLLHAESWIEDSAVDIVFDRGVYKPQNHDRQFYGWVKVKTALASSLNVPAVKVFKLLNDDSFWSKLKDMNFRELKEPDHYGPALALGVADVTLEDLTQAYRTLAQKGVYSPLRFDLKTDSTNEKRIFTEESAKEVAQIISQSENRALGFGLDSALSLQGASVKTGTSKDMRDNWCVGFNSRFTVGVWVGNFSGEPMWNVMGISGAAPIWKKVMEWLYEKYPDTEVSLAPVAQNKTNKAPQVYPNARIVYPQDGMVLALDPAIPSVNQKMPLLVEGPKAHTLHWKIDGKSKVSAHQAYLWTPSLGKHTFELYQDNELKGSVQVLVK